MFAGKLANGMLQDVTQRHANPHQQEHPNAPYLLEQDQVAGRPYQIQIPPSCQRELEVKVLYPACEDGDKGQKQDATGGQRKVKFG